MWRKFVGEPGVLKKSFCKEQIAKYTFNVSKGCPAIMEIQPEILPAIKSLASELKVGYKHR